MNPRPLLQLIPIRMHIRPRLWHQLQLSEILSHHVAAPAPAALVLVVTTTVVIEALLIVVGRLLHLGDLRMPRLWVNLIFSVTII